jgi:hypothetical protein
MQTNHTRWECDRCGVIVTFVTKDLSNNLIFDNLPEGWYELYTSSTVMKELSDSNRLILCSDCSINFISFMRNEK